MKSIRNAAMAFGCAVAVSSSFAQVQSAPIKVTTGVTTSSSSVAIQGLEPQNVQTNGLTVSTTMSVTRPKLAAPPIVAGAKPKIAFPPTPAPRVEATTMSQAQLDQHILPQNILSQTSDVIALSYNGFRRSKLDPCGCVSHQLGGLDKEASVIKRIKELGIPVALTDAGGFTIDNPTDTDLARTKLLLRALHSLGANAVNVGYTDLSAGVDKLKAAGESANVKLISANVTDASGKLLFDPYFVDTVKTPGGEVKIAYVGVTRPRVPVAKVKNTTGSKAVSTPTPPAGTNDTAASYTAGDSLEALQKYIPEARQKADLVVVLAYDRRDKVSELLKDLGADAKADIAVSGEFLQAQANVLDVNGTKLVSGGFEGRQTGLLTFSTKDKKISAASNQFIEILQSIPMAPDVTKYLVEAKSLTTPPAALLQGAKATPAKLNLTQDAGSTVPANGKPAEKQAPAKLDLSKE